MFRRNDIVLDIQNDLKSSDTLLSGDFFSQDSEFDQPICESLKNKKTINELKEEINDMPKIEK